MGSCETCIRAYTMSEPLHTHMHHAHLLMHLKHTHCTENTARRVHDTSLRSNGIIVAYIHDHVDTRIIDSYSAVRMVCNGV
jgi:hypothetical protein